PCPRAPPQPPGPAQTASPRSPPEYAKRTRRAIKPVRESGCPLRARVERPLTTNGLERFNQELKRRTRVVRIFPNREACLRLVTALCVEQSEEWLSGRKYLDMELLDN